MKNIIFLIILTVILLPSCKFTEDKNVSPNSPTKVTESLLLTNSEITLYSLYGSNLARMGALWTQQVGVSDGSSQFVGYDVYTIDETVAENEWTTIYSDAIKDLDDLIDMATSKGDPYYIGMAKVLKAMALGIATDTWGDVPCSQAAKGLEFINPKYDPQQAVYQDIIRFLKEAIVHFEAAEADNILLPGPDDVVFGGDVAKWTAAARMLIVRYENHLSKKDPTGSASKVLAQIDLLGTDLSASNDMIANFGTNASNANFWYQFESQRGYLAANSFMANLLDSLSDPRVDVYYDVDRDTATGAVIAADPGDANPGASRIGSFFLQPNSPMPLVTAYETFFNEAEAALRAGNAARAATAYSNGIQANLSAVGVTGSAAANYLAAQARDASTITIKDIMLQKYIAMYLHIETWTDYRRTGYPQITPSVTSRSVPRRFPTTQAERLNNQNAVVISDPKTPVWWDL